MGDQAQRHAFQRQQIYLRPNDALGEAIVLQQRAPIALALRRQALKQLELALRAADLSRLHTLMAQQRLGIGPALVELAQQRSRRNFHVIEEDLIDLAVAVQQLDRP